MPHKLSDLYANSTSGDKLREAEGRARGLRVMRKRAQVLIGKHHNRPTLYVAVQYTVRGVTDTYDCEVLVAPAANRSVINNPAYIFCSCPHFKYRYAHVLHQTGNLYAMPELGEALVKPPVETNPTMVVSLCKHLLAVVQHMQRNSTSLKALLNG